MLEPNAVVRVGEALFGPIYGSAHVPSAVMNANAALMTAAPDLLAALRQVEWAGTERDEDGSEFEVCPWCGNQQDFWHLEGCALADAIAKAIGGAK